MAKGGARPGSGRKPGVSKATLIREKIGEFITDADVNELMKKAKQMADKGDGQMIRYLLDQKFGKAPQRIEMSGPNGDPISVDLRQKSTEELLQFLKGWTPPKSKEN